MYIVLLIAVGYGIGWCMNHPQKVKDAVKTAKDAIISPADKEK